MSDLHFELFLEKMDWNTDDFKTDVTHLKSYKIPNVFLTEKIIDDLHIEIIQTKGDWLSFNCNVIGENYYIQSNIIFHSMDMSDDDDRIIKQVIEKIDRFLHDLKPESVTNNLNKFDFLDQIIDDDGLVIKAHEGGDWGVAEEITQLLNSNNLPYKTIRRQQSRFDGGASGGFEEIILFIGASAVSGITWDVIKGILTSRFDFELENIRASHIDRLRFKQLRKNIAERVVEEHKDLVLIDFYEQESEIICEFKIYGIFEKTITVICDYEYRIKELKMERK
ncbi:hypothetical protein B2I21_00860 [Chryseobacterium mucoviscidosis]|nr:hypothetical protein B2I21_00860 [Chryseobacterium mucoviscidosis]